MRGKRKGTPELIEGWVSAAMARLGAPPVWKIAAAWQEICGGRVAERSTPLSLVHDLLTIEVPNASWAADMVYLRADLIERIARLTGLMVRDLRFVHGSAEVASARAAAQAPLSHQAADYERDRSVERRSAERMRMDRQVDEFAQQVVDPDLRRALVALGHRVVSPEPARSSDPTGASTPAAPGRGPHPSPLPRPQAKAKPEDDEENKPR